MTSSAEPAGDEPGAGAAIGWWPWVYGVIFVLLSASALYFIVQPVPLARRMDAARSRLVLEPDGAVRARIVVLGVPGDGQVAAVAHAPDAPGARWRVDVLWTPEPAARLEDGGTERVLEVRIPERVAEIEVWDRRGGVAPERMIVRLVGPEER